MEKINLKKIIAEAREIAEALDEFADKLEKLEKKYADKREEPDAERTKSTADPLKYSNNGFPHLMEEDDDHDNFIIARHMHAKYSNNGFPHFLTELTEDDLEESEDEE